MIGWLGVVLTLVFGVLDVIQFVQRLLNKAKWNSARAQLEQIRVSCTKTLEKPAVLDNEASRQFVEDLMHQIRGIERGLGFAPLDVGVKRS